MPYRVFTFIFLVIGEVEHIFKCLFAIRISSVNCLFTLFATFSISYFVFFCIDLKEPFLFYREQNFIKYLLLVSPLTFKNKIEKFQEVKSFNLFSLSNFGLILRWALSCIYFQCFMIVFFYIYIVNHMKYIFVCGMKQYGNFEYRF